MRFLIFIFAFLFIAAIFFVRDEILNKIAKIIATTLIMLLCAGAYFYESASERSAKLEEEMVFKFNAGARLRCGGAINSAAETRGAANSFSEKHGADAKNLGSQAGEANLNAQGEAASAAQANDTQTSDPQASAQNSKATRNFAADKEQTSAQIVTRESFTYSFSLGAFIAKKSAGAEFKGKTYKIKECVYDQ
nr:hypothetical protein [uncultured Campylobacter sp.]